MDVITIWILLVIVVNIIFSAIVGYVAGQKGRSVGGFFALSFFLSFIVGILAVIAIPRRDIPAGSAGSSQFVSTYDGLKAKCPYCAEWVKAEANICRFCGKDISEAKQKFSAEEMKLREETAAAYEAEQRRMIQAREEELKARKQAWANRIRRPSFWILSVGGLVAIAVVIAVVSVINSQARSEELLARENWAVLIQQCEDKLNSEYAQRTVEINSDNTEIVVESFGDMPDAWLDCVGDQIAVDAPNDFSGENEFNDKLGRAIDRQGNPQTWSGGGLGIKEAEFGNLHISANRTSSNPDRYTIVITRTY